MKITEFKIPDVFIIELKVFGDDGGSKHTCYPEQSKGSFGDCNEN